MNSALSHEKILVVDDEPHVREITQQLLNGYYATVLIAASALEGLEKVRIHRPHLIVSDILACLRWMAINSYGSSAAYLRIKAGSLPLLPSVGLPNLGIM